MIEQSNETWLLGFRKFLERKYPERTTATHYMSDLKQFLMQYEGSLLSVTQADIDQFVDSQRASGKAAATVKRRAASLKSFFDYMAAELQEPRRLNPVNMKRQGGKQTKQLPRDLSNEEVKRLLAVISSERDRAMVVLMLYGGLRVEEVVTVAATALVIPEQAEEPVRIRVCGKGRKERIVYIPQESFEPVQSYLTTLADREQTEPLFCNHRGRPLRCNGVQWLLRRYGQQCGVAVTPHRLRHTCARWLAEGRMPLLSLSRFLGHSDVHTTQRYIDNADVGVREQYQVAMTQAKELVITTEPAWSEEGEQLTPTVQRQAVEQFDPPQWIEQWPLAIREGTLNWLTVSWPQWKQSRRQANAMRHVRSLRPFWLWQWQRRSIDSWDDLQLADVEAFISAELERGMKAVTVKSVLDRVYAVLRFLADRQQLSPLIARPDIHLPDSLPQHLQPQELVTIETFAARQLPTADSTTLLNIALYYVLAHSGLRISELLDLLVRDVDLSSGRLRISAGKGNKDRIVYLTKTATDALQLYLQSVPHTPNDLFFSIHERPLTYSTAYKRLRAFACSAGVPDVSPLRLRHTYATTLLNNGMTITALRKLLGHENLNTTLIYARLADTTVRHQYQQAMENVTNLVSN
jgi:site-specific recombinase XerD